MSRTSARLRWIAGHQDVATAGRRRAGRSARRGRSPTAAIPRAASASLSPISWVAIDFTLTTSSAPCACAIVATMPHASSASRAQCTTAPRASAAPRAAGGARRGRQQHVVLDRGRRPARSASQSATSATTRGALGADRRGRVREVAAQLAVAERRRAQPRGTAASRRTSPVMQADPRSRPGPRPGACTRTPERCRESRPPMCIRHELSPATSTSAPVSRTCRALSSPSPPRCRRSSPRTCRRTRSTPRRRAGRRSSSPRTARSSRVGRSPTPSMRSEWQVGW